MIFSRDSSDGKWVHLGRAQGKRDNCISTGKPCAMGRQTEEEEDHSA